MDHSQQFDTEDVAEVEKLNPISREPLNLSSQARGDQWETYRTKSYFKSFSTPGTGLPTTSDNKLQRPYSGSEASFSSRSSSTASGEQKPDSYSRIEKSPAESISSKVEKNWPLDLSVCILGFFRAYKKNLIRSSSYSKAIEISIAFVAKQRLCCELLMQHTRTIFKLWVANRLRQI